MLVWPSLCHIKNLQVIAFHIFFTEPKVSKREENLKSFL